MSFIVDFMRSLVSSPSKAAQKENSPITSEGTTQPSPQQSRGTKRLFDDMDPDADADRSPQTGRRVRKKLVAQMDEDGVEHAFAGLALHERDLWGPDGGAGLGISGSFKDAITVYSGRGAFHATGDEMDLDESEQNLYSDEAYGGEDEMSDGHDTPEGDEDESEHVTSSEDEDASEDPGTPNMETPSQTVDEGSRSLSVSEEHDLSTPSRPRQPAARHEARAKRPDWHSPQSVANEMKRRETNLAIQTVGWSAADIKLYRDLQLRGLRPMLSQAWTLDFPSLPLALFTNDDQQVVVKALGLRPNYSPDDHGARAFKHLMGVGQEVRDRIALSCQRPAEMYIKKAVHAYFRWALTDANLFRRRAYLPLVSVQAASKRTNPMALQAKLVRKMRKLKSKWIDALGSSQHAALPPLYGIMISHSVMAIVAPVNLRLFGEDLDEHGAANGMKDSIRILNMLDWSEDGQDVWSAFAVAILGVHCRDLLLQVLDGRELKGVEVGGYHGDPDA